MKPLERLAIGREIREITEITNPYAGENKVVLIRENIKSVWGETRPASPATPVATGEQQRLGFADEPFPAKPKAALPLTPFIDRPKSMRARKQALRAEAERDGELRDWGDKLPRLPSGRLQSP